MDKRAVLQATNFGQRVAEEESQELERYFVLTDNWARTFGGEVDIIYGPKGSGKSALYSLLIRKENELFDRGIVVVSAEKPRGTPVFNDVQKNPPTTEDEFVALWKLYLLTLVSAVLTEYGVKTEEAKIVGEYLADANLVESRKNLGRLLQGVGNYVRSYFRRPESLEGTLSIDPMTGLPVGFGGKISFAEPVDQSRGVMSVSTLLHKADTALRTLDSKLWVLLDRLDVAFTEHPDLEENALRALFRAYLDMLELETIQLKIFLRSDIWTRITQKGFREASHVTRHITIKWDTNSLMNLVIRRALKNQAILDAYGVDPEHILENSANQIEFFYRLFPDQVDIGPNKSRTFDWILNRTMDGTRQPAPREIIHFLNEARDAQLRQHELGTFDDEGDELFSRSALRDALPEVSKVRLHQTLYAEYPGLRQHIEELAGEKTLQSPESLAAIWRCDTTEASERAQILVEIGFFERRGSKREPTYWIPFLYRDATQTLQGTADKE